MNYFKLSECWGVSLMGYCKDCGGELESALPAIRALGGAAERWEDYRIPHTQVSHRVIFIKKIAPTPSQYPRRWAKIQKSPISGK